MTAPDQLRAFVELLRDTIEELSICDEDDLAGCGLPAGWYGTRVQLLNPHADPAGLVVRLGGGADYQVTIAPGPAPKPVRDGSRADCGAADHA